MKGSWNDEIRIWKLHEDLKSFSLAGTLQAMGVINSLMLLVPQRGFLETCSWTQGNRDGIGKPSHTAQPTVLIVAGLGKEHRLGRWIKKGEAQNCTTIFSLFSAR
jgi:ribosomal RNA-processing protein 9